MKLILLFILSAFAADVESDFQPYVTNFKHDYFKYKHKVIYLKNLKIFWNYGNEIRAGACTQSDDGGTKWIEINKLQSGWGNYTECQREELIYHELAHCLLGLHHSESGIMHFAVRDPQTCEHTREASKAILFRGKEENK